MSKAYSNKALPAGTILREWRLEQVLGVGGFGIVYKARGIYFDEMVAIKEYFPSSISERDEDATVVPIDSDAEEVHALGLKKFVEEAKLLWNLSTPTRHPNIVSVRSLFEIHGTAYMVMDFEDGMSLSRMLKQGTRFNEASLTNLIRPIAEGLERAHRVGVLHRDIKPPNILVNEDGRSVLIDFGSARFESGEATSTTVTFHTPPYAAIEQYVRTYEQGPWTDIYALGVVLYECIAGEKPPEVLERMHGGLGKPLAAGNWPGYSQKFLAAVDAAMMIKPSERPQSISQWLDMFDGSDSGANDADDDDATRIATFVPAPHEFVPVAPAPPGFAPSTRPETQVPDDPAEVQFKRAGEDTNASQKHEEIPPPPVTREPELEQAPQSEPEPEPEPIEEATEAEEDLPPAEVEVPPPPVTTPPVESQTSPEPAKVAAPDTVKAEAAQKVEPSRRADILKTKPAAGAAKKMSPAMIGGGVLAAVLLVAGGVYLFGGSKNAPDAALVDDADALGQDAVTPVDIAAAGGVDAAIASLAKDAAAAGVPQAALKRLQDASAQLSRMDAELSSMSGDAASARQAEMEKLASAAGADFASLLASNADTRARSLARDIPWADPRSPTAAAGETPDRRNVAAAIRSALSRMHAAAGAASGAADAAAALTAAREAMAGSNAFRSSTARAYRLDRNPTTAAEEQSTASGEQTTDTASPEPEAPPAAASNEAANDAQRKQLSSTISSARDIANKVIRMGDRDKPGSDASQKEKDGYLIRQANVKTARDYQKYLDTLENSMRGTRTKAEADQLIAQASQTRGYLAQLLAGSQQTLN